MRGGFLKLNIMSEKKKYFTMKQGSSKLIGDIESIIETLKVELEENTEIGETIEFEFGTVEMTEEEVAKLGDFDGF